MIDNTPFDSMWKHSVCENYLHHRISFKFNHPLFDGKCLLEEPLKLNESEVSDRLETLEDFDQRVCREKVLLEFCVHGHNDTLSGYIRVANITYHKKVFVRFTYDDWSTTEEVVANYNKSYGDYATDQFSFDLTLKKEFTLMQFIIGYESEGHGTLWDNHRGKSYGVAKEIENFKTSGSQQSQPAHSSSLKSFEICSKQQI